MSYYTLLEAEEVAVELYSKYNRGIAVCVDDTGTYSVAGVKCASLLVNSGEVRIIKLYV